MSVETETQEATYLLDRLLFDARNAGRHFVPDTVTRIDLGSFIFEEVGYVREFKPEYYMSGNVISPVYISSSGQLDNLSKRITTYQFVPDIPVRKGQSHILD